MNKHIQRHTLGADKFCASAYQQIARPLRHLQNGRQTYNIHSNEEKSKSNEKRHLPIRMLRPSAYEEYISAFQQIGSADEALTKFNGPGVVQVKVPNTISLVVKRL